MRIVSPLTAALPVFALLLACGCKPRTSAPSASSPQSAGMVGQAIYEIHCAACHGNNGEGNGPASIWLFPKPRNFSAGLFKIQSTPAGSLPTDEDLYQTVTRGMPGSSMPSFTYLPEKERRDVVQYIKHLTASPHPDGKHVSRFEEARVDGSIAQPLDVPPEPPATLEALTRGKEVFAKLQCSKCHGETGAGNGPSAATLKDSWGMPLFPRDFNTGAFRGGHMGKDLYLRIATGMAGSPMPPFGDDVVSREDRWALVLYIQSLRRKEVEINDILTPSDRVIHAMGVKKVPSDPADPVWETMDPARIPLNPLWPEPHLIPAVAVRALHTGKKLALLLQWKDPVSNGAPIRAQDFQDAVAIQFPLNGIIPFLGMGDSQNPVNIWHWKAGWQEEASGSPLDVDSVYASMHVDVYPESKPLFRSAEAAGNLMAQPIHESPVEDANARGFGTLKSQPPSGQNVMGKGVWVNGHWNVLFVRDFRSPDPDDVRIKVGLSIPISFAVWDGQQRDRNGRKVISNWYHLKIEPH